MFQRRLVAIFAADVEGYSRHMGVDETATLRVLSSHRAIIGRLVGENRGRIANTAGDSVLAEFPSAVDAVTCALAVQTAVAEANAAWPEAERLHFRIGVHVGDVMVKDGDLFGDGVNIAARLQALARAGGTCLSVAAYDAVRKVLTLDVEDLGPQSVKNIDEPVRVFEISGPAAGAKRGAAPVGSGANRRSDRPVVAVLPFANRNAPDEEYFSDGITEDIITELARFRELAVLARASTFTFRNPQAKAQDVHRALGADFIVEGSIRRMGERVRVSAQLLDAASGDHLWAERYERALSDVFALQEEIARSVAVRVAQRVIDEGEMAARRRPPGDLRAYDLFLQALRLGGRSFTPAVLAEIESLHHRALAIDPSFARAYSGLAFIHRDRSTDVIAGVRAEPDEHLIKAFALAEKALQLDPNDPRIQSTFGLICAHFRDFERAERHLTLARSMNPNDAVILILSAWLMSMRGKASAGLEQVDLACRLNPRHPPWYESFRARLLFQSGEAAEAAALLKPRRWDVPARHLRDLAWCVAATAISGEAGAASHLAAAFVDEMRANWRGDPSAGPAEYVDWLVWFSLLERAEDRDLLREGLRRAGLPA